MLIAIAIGIAYQIPNSAISGAGAPSALLRPIDVSFTPSGTAIASAYQTQLTRQRINRNPMAFNPARPSVTDTTISAAIKTPGAKKLCQKMAVQQIT